MEFQPLGRLKRGKVQWQEEWVLEVFAAKYRYRLLIPMRVGIVRATTKRFKILAGTVSNPSGPVSTPAGVWPRTAGSCSYRSTAVLSAVAIQV